MTLEELLAKYKSVSDSSQPTSCSWSITTSLISKSFLLGIRAGTGHILLVVWEIVFNQVLQSVLETSGTFMLSWFTFMCFC
jgi:hypothetical protein